MNIQARSYLIRRSALALASITLVASAWLPSATANAAAQDSVSLPGQANSPLMSELQNTERELVDALQTQIQTVRASHCGPMGLMQLMPGTTGD